jgi:putative transcriptional regulator
MDYIKLLHASGLYEKKLATVIPFYRNIDIFANAVSAGTGFSTRTIRAVERGERDPSAEFMLRIAAYFNLMVEDIFQIKSD